VKGCALVWNKKSRTLQLTGYRQKEALIFFLNAEDAKARKEAQRGFHESLECSLCETLRAFASSAFYKFFEPAASATPSRFDIPCSLPAGRQGYSIFLHSLIFAHGNKSHSKKFH
jgi:hypothetical protein